MSAFNMIIIKNYFQGIPMELEEAAIIDGSNDLITFVRIILPLSAPVLASVSLFYAVSHWNSYFNAMLYINNSDMEVITIVLRRLVFLTTQVAEDSTFDWGAAGMPPIKLSRWPPRCCPPCRSSASIRLCRSSLPKVLWSARSRADTKQYNHFLYKKEKNENEKGTCPLYGAGDVRRHARRLRRLRSGSTSASDAASSADSAASGTPTVSFMIPDFTGHVLSNEHSDEVIAKYEAYTGTHVEWRTEANDTYSEKFGLTLMDKDNMPMILTATKTLDQNANAADAAKRGAFWDLTEYLQDSEAYPNLSQISPDVLKGLTVDGQIIGIPRSRAIGRNGLGYRTDWAEAVGITEAPKTVEDVYDMLYKFTYDDPDGNGANDTYGLEMCKYTGPWDIIQTWFGCGNGWVEQDGKLVPVHQTAEYKEALDWMRKIYADGLVRPDWATVDTANFQVDSQKGVTGVFVDTMDGTKRIWKYFEDNAIADVNDASKIATMTSVGPINGHTLATTGYNGFYLITKSGAKTEEDVKACLHFLDKMCDPEMMALADYA